jgi:hypothetical protein
MGRYREAIMKKLFLIKGSDGILHPVDQESENIIQKWKTGAEYGLEYKLSRNARYHRMIFAIANMAVENAPEDSPWNGKPAIMLIKAVELDAGFVEPQLKLDGTINMVAKSIAFDQMDQDEFDKLYNPLVKECARILNITEDELRRN